MRIACFTFTRSGEILACNLKEKSPVDIDIYNREHYGKNLRAFCGKAFEEYDALVFFSAIGIAVRMIAPYIRDKKQDPAVVVIDDLGRYAVSLLSGHIGGANELAEHIADIIHALPVITTASDGRNFEAVDVFALRNDYVIENMEDARKITALMVDNRKIEFLSELNAKIRYHNIVEEKGEGRIIVSSRLSTADNKPCVVLRPKTLHIGIGCKKDVPGSIIVGFIEKTLQENNYSSLSIGSIGTIEAKKKEEGIMEACTHFGCRMRVFSAREIEGVQHLFRGSDFVEAALGVRAVAEPCAYLCGKNIIISRIAEAGVTIAVSKEV